MMNDLFISYLLTLIFICNILYYYQHNRMLLVIIMIWNVTFNWRFNLWRSWDVFLLLVGHCCWHNYQFQFLLIILWCLFWLNKPFINKYLLMKWLLKVFTELNFILSKNSKIFLWLKNNIQNINWIIIYL